MCTEEIRESIVLKEDRFAFKKVRYTNKPEVFLSPTNPDERGKERGFKTTGKTLKYRIGKQTTSKAPGIYCYVSTNRIWTSYAQTVVRVRIPKGSRVFLGVDGGKKVILAEHVIPLNVVRSRR